MVTYASFIAQYPEFANATEALVVANIAEAQIMVDPTVYLDKTDAAVSAFAAHLTASNPLGEMARLSKSSEDTIYLLRFKRMQRAMSGGYRII